MIQQNNDHNLLNHELCDGIDVGFRSQYVAKVIPSAEGDAEPAIETQLNESKENEFKSVQRDGIDE